MPVSRRHQPTIDRWLLTAALGYHAGQVSADAYRRLTTLRRHADPPRVLDDHAPPRTHCEQHPE